MTQARMPGSFRNSHQTCWINTHRITLAEYEDETAFPIVSLPSKPTKGLTPMQRALAAAVGSMAAFAVILYIAFLKG